MAKNDDFEEEMRKADAAAYRASLSDEPGTESTSAFMKRTGIKATPPKATVGGPKIVTKEQMQKAGFDNLRDYMNAQKGLKRRDGFASEAQKKTFAATPRGTQTEGDAGEAEARAARQKMMQEESERQAEMKREARGVKDTPSKPAPEKTKSGSESFAEKQEKASKVMAAARRQQYGFKSGGSVSSASKRADGCAVKGKTRGRMV
jgi:hypothetical protein